jgi:hypothetical protein
MKWFSISKDIAEARVLRDDWWILLREYISRGEKMRFCCGKVDVDGVCCCGGWMHDEDQKVYSHFPVNTNPDGSQEVFRETSRQATHAAGGA